MATAMQREVVGSGEGAVALRAAERFDSRVLAEVSGELVGAGEAPGAALPRAVVRLLSCTHNKSPVNTLTTFTTCWRTFTSASTRVPPWTLTVRAVNVGSVSGAPTCVYPPVRFEVGALGVNFFTAFIIAHVDPPPLQVQRIGVDGLQVHTRPETHTHTGGGSLTASQFQFSCFHSSAHFAFIIHILKRSARSEDRS